MILVKVTVEKDGRILVIRNGSLIRESVRVQAVNFLEYGVFHKRPFMTVLKRLIAFLSVFMFNLNVCGLSMTASDHVMIDHDTY
jgi:hypothetical protein